MHEAVRVSEGRVEDGVTPSAPPVADLDTDVVTAPAGPDEVRRKLPSKRRRRRLLAVFLAVWAVVVVAAAAAW